VCFGAPIFASLTSRMSRRPLLVAAMCTYALGHLLCALAPSYALVMLLRIASGFGAAIFTPQAAATAGTSVPAEQRGSAVAWVFLGFSVANVLGTPIGIALGGALGWRVALGAIGLAAAACAVLLRATLPDGLYATPIDRSAWRAVIGDGALVLVLLTTLLQAAAQFVVISYMAVVFHAYLGAGPGTVSLLFAWIGLCGIAGNVFAGSLIGRVGAERIVLITMVLMLIGMLLWPLTPGAMTVMLVALGIWGLGSFAAVSAQQARVIALAPTRAPASIALNSSAFYLGQAAGAAVGGMVLSTLGMSALSWIGVPLLMFGFATTWAASLRARATLLHGIAR
jgi:predicted MFS family arabinose efflux permease